MKNLSLFITAFFMIFLLYCSAPEKQIKYTDLIYHLTDMESLYVLPDKGEQCAQWSSCDRAGIFNNTTGKYENWDANADGSGFIRMEGEDMVLAEMNGPGHAWWGEGDEKFFVDGEVLPSKFGTGTEDYFGYARGTPEYFEKPFFSQLKTMNNLGYQSVSRLHITDNIPFMSSLECFLEKYYPNECGTQYKAVVYWYLKPGGSNPHLSEVQLK